VEQLTLLDCLPDHPMQLMVRVFDFPGKVSDGSEHVAVLELAGCLGREGKRST